MCVVCARVPLFLIFCLFGRPNILLQDDDQCGVKLAARLSLMHKSFPQSQTHLISLIGSKQSKLTFEEVFRHFHF